MSEKNLEKYLKKMQDYRKKVAKDKELSLKLLVNAGICNSNGKLEIQYR